MVLQRYHMSVMQRRLPKRVDGYNRISLQSYEKNINVFDIYRHEMILQLLLKGHKDKDKLINKKLA